MKGTTETEAETEISTGIEIGIGIIIRMMINTMTERDRETIDHYNSKFKESLDKLLIS